MILSINAEKPCDKIQHRFMIKLSRKWEWRELASALIVVMYGKTTTNSIFSDENLRVPLRSEAGSIPPKIRNETRVSIFNTFIQHSFGSPSHGYQRKERNKWNPNWKTSKNATVCRLYESSI